MSNTASDYTLAGELLIACAVTEFRLHCR